jgi:FMN reductase
MSRFSIVGLSGSPSEASSTRRLVDQAVARIGAQVRADVRIVDIADLDGLAVRSRQGAGPELEGALRAVETADLIIAGSPVYKGSYTGLFKHFVDLVDYKALIGKPVGLVATGGSERHALVIEHQLRPLFAFFQAHVLGTGVFLTSQDIAGGTIGDPALTQRLDRLVSEAVHALTANAAVRRVEHAA